MEFFRDTHIDFMKYRKYWIIVSLALVVIGIFSVFVHGKLNVGIDFAGGTQLTLQFAEEPELDDLRRILNQAGVEDSTLQRFGDSEAHEVLIKTPVVEGTEEGARDPVVDALDAEFNAEHYAAEGAEASAVALDLNRAGVEDVTSFLAARDPEGRLAGGTVDPALPSPYAGVADAVIEVRRENGIITSWDEVGNAPGVGSEVATALEADAYLGEFAVLGIENVGPQMGRELRLKGILAVILSLLGMLAYIWIRFELRFGIGALMAVLHDVLVGLGLFALAGFEFNLTTIAAFLTLVGYSVNDTVVIFDRVRENMQKSPSTPLLETMNRSINECLSRTVLTSGTTLLAVGALLVLGGDVLRGFAFVLTIGVFVGTYSSIYIASPFALLWENLFSDAARAARKSGKGKGGKRNKARTA